MSLNPITGHHESSAMPQRVRDVLGRLKVSLHQNIYEADFEYGPQPLRWEQLTAGAGSILQVPSSGGVRMRVTNAQGDITVRQSRPYHRYQPGKTMFMATALNLGTVLSGNVQRVGFFDDSNGAFFEQGQPTLTNPYGMYVVVRTDVGGTLTEHRVGLDSWNGDMMNVRQMDFTRIQMFWMEYAWYGAGVTRFGFYINGEPFLAHQIGWGNLQLNLGTQAPQQTPWARTGNLPVRYEQRNLAGTTQTNDMYHYGVSVVVEGRTDDQRGFTYSYGLPNTVQVRSVSPSTTRYPLLTVRGRQLGTQEYGTVYASTTGNAITSIGSASTSVFVGSITGTTLTVTSTTSGTIAIGQQLTGTGIAWGTFITAGSGSTWTVSSYQTVPASTTFNGYAITITFPASTFTSGQFNGRMIFFPGQGGTGADKNGIVARILATNTNSLIIADPVTGGALTSTPTVASQVTPTASAGTTGGYTFTVSNASGITVGMGVTGTGIPTGSIVTNIASTTITINQALTANSSGTATFNTGYCIGLINRGQLLPKRLMISSDTRCVVELISGSIANPSAVTGANFVPLNSLGSNNSFAERDAIGTVITGGEVVFAFTLAAGSGLQDIDLSYFFPLYNNIRGSQIDQLTLAISTVSGTTSVVGGHLICQEAMS
jgi:hypothetical protein